MVRVKMNVVCVAVGPMPVTAKQFVFRARGQNVIPTEYYNQLLGHHQKVTRCQTKERCDRKWTAWALECEKQYSRKLRSRGLVPAFFVKRGTCKIPKPDCGT